MEKPVVNHQNLINFPVKSHALPLSNGIHHHSDDDIEMIALDSLSYTSLKDLIPSSSPSSVASPTGGSWREIPIKDPLVQHAAWAYLQPMAEARDEDDRWWKRLERKCCGLFGCLNDVVLVVFNGWFAEGSSDGVGDDDDKVD
ncbi:hypothetical protein C2S52_007491 [Perilla frutescens var. hirtella]|nr:hypothetical protein C2S51_013989 [Perilla frutescens var. frutescens]KAH6777077.1 hypothetical protein C2S51_008389 [Perilla frutescens var. frutescens]KAH6787939.1 hypothetical protein C2S52_007491 [Perilla frutescens var. hirtella]